MISNGALLTARMAQLHTCHCFPIAKATRVVVFRVKKYLPPGLQVFAQESFSYKRLSGEGGQPVEGYEVP